MLGQRTGSHFLHRLDSFDLIKIQLKPVVRKKKTPEHPSDAFVAVRKAVVARKTVGVTCRKCRRIGVAVRREILRSCKSRFNGPLIAHSVETAMLR